MALFTHTQLEKRTSERASYLFNRVVCLQMNEVLIWSCKLFFVPATCTLSHKYTPGDYKLFRGNLGNLNYGAPSMKSERAVSTGEKADDDVHLLMPFS